MFHFSRQLTFKKLEEIFFRKSSNIQGVYIIRWDFNDYFMFHVIFK
jgi:hypothetical protein